MNTQQLLGVAMGTVAANAARVAATYTAVVSASGQDVAELHDLMRRGARPGTDDADRAEQIFRGIDPLTPNDIAQAVQYVLVQPRHVNIDRIVLRPTAQGSQGRCHRQ